MGTLVFQATLGGAVNIIGPNIASTINFTLPSADGSSGQTWTTNGSGVLSFGTLGISGGGTGQTTANAAFNALAPSQTGNSGKYLTTDGSNTSWATNPLGTVTSVGGTGTVSGISLSGTVTTSGNLTLGGALDLSAYNGAGAFTTLSASSTVTLSGGTANGVTYLNGSKVLTSGSALVFDGTNFGVGTSQPVGDSGWTNFTLKGTNGGEFWFQDSTGTGTYTSSQGYIGTSSTDFKMMSFGVSRTLMFGVNNTEGMRLTSTGLGIGTSSPLLTSSGRGNVTINGSSNAILAYGVGGVSKGYLYHTGTDMSLINSVSGNLNFGTSDSTKATLDSSGNLGLGVTPSAWAIGKVLQIGTSVGSGFLYGGGAGSTTWYGVNNYYGSGGYTYATSYYATQYRQDPSTGQHQWFNSGTSAGTAGATFTPIQAMSLTAAGALLVGTTSNPNAYRQVLSFDGATVGGLDFLDTFSPSGTTVACNFRRAGTSVGSITTTLSATAYNTSSDYRLKNTIAPMTGALAKVVQLKPVTYKWNVDGSDGEGFIAHELAEVCPQAVNGEKDAVDENGNPKYQGIDTSFLVATLTAAIQEQQAIIESLKARLDAANL